MEQKPDRRPDILLIVSDQHNPSFLGCYGDGLAQTPNLDRLAAGGVLFEQAYCNSPLCGPSRQSFKTGRYPGELGCWDNSGTLASDVPTFAHALGIAGYEVALAGRCHWRGPDQRHGFEPRLVGDVTTAYWAGLHNYWLRVRDKDYCIYPLQSRSFLTHFSGPGDSQILEFDRAVLKASLEFVRERSARANRRPYCLLVGFSAPKNPFVCPPELFELYDGKVPAPSLPDDHLDRLHPVYRRALKNANLESLPLGDVIRVRTAYYGLVTFTDNLVGKLLAELERSGLRENTLVSYFPDHGEMAGEHGLWWKNSLYDGASRVPWIVSLPRELPEGIRVQQPVSLVDLFPSLCDWTGAPSPPGLRGRSLNELILGDPSFKDRAVISELYQGFPGVDLIARMVRKGPWKYNYYHGERPELFNLEQDPGEFCNLAEERMWRQTCDELRALALVGWDPQGIASLIRESRERTAYLSRWSRTVNPPDPDQWSGLHEPVPEEWLQNALDIPEYADWHNKRLRRTSTVSSGKQ